MENDQDGRCATCKYWQQAWYSKTSHICTRVVHPEYDADGFRIKTEMPDSFFKVESSRDCPAFLETGPRFGCVNYQLITNDPIEWDFGVPASQVDIERIKAELSGRTCFEVGLYLGKLKENAPETFARYEAAYLKP